MSVDIRSTLDGSCSAYGKMDDQQSESGRSSSTTSKRTLAIERFYPIFIGLLVVLNVILIILVAVVLSKTGQLNNVSVTDASSEIRPPEQLKAPDYGMERRILESIQLNRNLTLNVTASLKKDVLAMMTSFYALLGWKKSGNIFYKLETNDRASYAVAKARCQGNGGRLAAKILRDPAAVKEMIKGRIVNSDVLGSYFWVGLNDLNTEGVWKWIDGGATYNVTTAWWPGEPNQMGGNEDCGNIIGITTSKVLINDAPCSWRYSYMCEVEILDSIA